jgi:acetylornithine deacetylase/succinyl-diaminopimelate desuccinylase-like protein
VDIAFFAEPFDVGDSGELVVALRGAVTEALGREAEVIGFRGASDARFIAATGADVVLCGPGDITLAHTARESIDVDELVRGAVAYAIGFARLLGAMA